MNSLPHFAVFMIGVGTRPAILLVHVDTEDSGDTEDSA